MSHTSWLWAVVGFVLCAASLRGEGLPSVAAATEPTAERIAALVEQLDLPDFVSRQAASHGLEEAGAVALPQLEAIASAGSREAAARALDILKRHYQSGGAEVKPAAREALERLASSEIASAAQKARDVLNPPKPPSIITPVGFQPPPPPRVNGFGGNFGGAFGGAAPNPGAFRKVSISDINGRRSVEIDERERRVKIETTAGTGIRVEVTDKTNIRNPTRTIDAKDLDDLRRKDAELARLYELYRVVIQRPAGVNAPLPLGIAPGFFPAMPMPGAANQLEIIDGLLQRYKQRLATDPNAQRMIDSLEQAKQRFKEMAPAGDAGRLVR